jgi:hypothetical protein
MTNPTSYPYFSVLVLLALIFIIPIRANSKDITEMVIKETPLDEQVLLFCDIYCLGNERKGILKSVTVAQTDKESYRVKGKAALRNRQVAGEPLNFTVYDRTIIVNSIGTLNSETCKLKVDDVTIENDFQNIVTNLLKSNSDIIGKVIDVPDCKKFLN